MKIVHGWSDGSTTKHRWFAESIQAGEGKLYLCAVKDVCTNRIVGYSVDDRMTSARAVAALTNAAALRRPTGTVVHSDRGSSDLLRVLPRCHHDSHPLWD